MDIFEQLISNIIDTRFESFPKDIIERAKDEVSDIIGCAICGVDDTGCPMLIDLIREWGGSEESTILAYGLKAPSNNVALANAVMARSFDYGIVDMCVEGKIYPAHIGETLVPTAVAIAEQKALSGKQLLTALIVGEDLTSRIMAASKSFGGWDWDMTGTVNTLGATAVAGKLWGLDSRQWRHAFGIALNQIGGSGQSLPDRMHCFKLNQGLAAQRGIFSARLASKGFTALRDPIFGERGYFALYSPEYNPEILTRNLGKNYYTEVTFKPYPSSRATHGAIECSVEIMRKNHIEASKIDEVTIFFNISFLPSVLREPFSAGEVPHASAVFSLEYTTANALLRGYPKPEHFTEESIRDPQICEMIKKIKIQSQEFPNESLVATTIRVKMKDGTTFTEHVNEPKGNELENPLTREEKREKFRHNVRFSKKVKMRNAEKALMLMEKLEDIQDITEIVKLLVADPAM